MTVRRALAILVALCAAVPATAQAAPTAVIPAYFYPDGTNWESATADSPPGSALILNPASGPGTRADPAYVSVVRAAQAAGRQVIGYVPTTYAKRRASAVRADVKRYADWYGVDGIFFDEAAADRALVRYYRDLYGYTKTMVTPVVGPSLVVLNPGIVPAEDYMTAGDVVVTFENTLAAYESATFPAWTASAAYRPERFAHLVHGAFAEADMRRGVCLARERNAARVYITDDVMSNPWDRLPVYWRQERAALLGACDAARSARRVRRRAPSAPRLRR